MKDLGRNKLVARTLLGGLGALLSTLAFTPEAVAQPDPFADYESWKAGESAEPVITEPPASSDPVTETGQWNWSLGARTQFSLGWASYERPVGDNGTATNLFFRLAPEVSTFVWDRVQVGFNAGLYSKLASNNPGDSTSETGMLMEATGFYYAPVTPRFSFVPGLGLGGYFGAGSRTLTTTVGNSVIETEDSTSTGGFSVAVYAGIAYQLSEHFQLRSGLALNALIGLESPDERSQSFSSYMTHVGIPVELYYNF